MREIFLEIGASLERGEAVALATVVRTRGSTPREVGAKMLVRSDGSTLGTVGGGVLEAAIIKAALEALEKGEPRLIQYGLRADKREGDYGVCGGDMDVFIDVIKPRPLLLLVGGGHVAKPLAKMAHMAGFRIAVLDDREEYANPQRFPDAAQILVGDLKGELERFPLTPETYVVIATRSHETDAEALGAVLDSPAAYIGLLGSRRKVSFIFRALRERGASDEALARVHAPIGLDIGAQTPEEIAVSILAEMVMRRRGGEGKPLSKGKG